MASSIKELSQVTIPEEYQLIKGEFVREVDSFVLTLRHKLSGARVLVLSNTDDNKVFNIGFRTTPKDSTGVPHIIEHTVLCGSKNFPAKDPFVELVKGSLNTYLNATTYPDKTMYPVASCNDKDFQNLMHVYLDAVFYPNIYLYEEIFKQEGWHYELESKDDEITYNGVVYNEMKGAFSSEESVLERFVLNSLFPDNTYGAESGGDPKEIPNLTYEDYLDFHRTYYHPSNSYIYLYGDMDIEEKLNFIDREYLKNFPAITVDSEIPLQKPFAKMKDLTTTYAVAQDADCTEKTYYAYAAAMDITLDQNLCKAFELLSYVLIEMPGAPLKQALLDAGIGSDIDGEFCDILRQSYFAVTTKNAKADQKEEFYKVIRSTLEDLVKNGIDKKALEAAINATEFREREADYGSFPKGLLYGIKTFKTWLYDDDQPYSSLCYDESYQFLRSQLSTDYFENLIQTYLLDNTHAVLVEMVPEKGLAVREEEALKEKLRQYKESLSEEEIEQLIADTKALKEYQETPTPKEVLEKIPMLKREDINPKIRPLLNEEKEIEGVTAVHHNITTNEIVYLNLLFDAQKCENYMPQMSFLTTLLGYMDTKKHSYMEYDMETNFYTGGITTDIGLYCQNQDADNYKLKFMVKTKVLRSQLSHALDLMAEMVFETLFTDEKHLREVVAESRSRTKVRLLSSGHQAAAGRVAAGLSKSSCLSDYYSGIGYYDYLVKLDENFEEEKEELVAGCKALLAKIFSKDNMLVSVTGNQEDYDAVAKELPAFLKRLDDFEKENAADSSIEGKLESLCEYAPVLQKRKEAFTTPAEIQYVATGGSFKGLTENFGALNVVRHLLNYDYLWNEVRVKGGAYGVACRFSREGEGAFTSYRDPNLSGTLETYKKAADYLAGYRAEEREVTKTIIGTISGMDTPLTPNMAGRRSMSAYLTGITEEQLQNERNQVLQCTVEDIQSLAPVMQAVADADNVCVIGNEKHIMDEKELFTEIKSLS
ncbi:MAG: insulinase family protein [Butyribacter sp.]|nr:insulinase family protein [bacterium]MDY3854155.1 insulinase family protein [Butyribacter sp.]